MTSHTFLRIVLYTMAAATLNGCAESPAPVPPAGQKADSVQAYILKADTVSRSVAIPGELKPFLQTDLAAKVQGYVREMRVDIGSRVRSGQLLAVIEAPEMNTQVAQAEAALASAKSRYSASRDRYERLLRASQHPSPGIVAPVDLHSALGQMGSDSAACQALEKQVRMYREVSGYLQLKAPFDGVITARHADPGALVASNTVLLTIQDEGKLRLQLAMPETYVMGTKTAPEIRFSTDEYPEKVFTARLARKAGAIDPSTRTELWEFDLENSDHLLKAGAFLTVRINMSREYAGFLLPSSAIATTLEKKFVIRVEQGKAVWVDVRQGMTTEKGIEIFGDIHAGDTILLKATDERKPGSPVTTIFKK